MIDERFLMHRLKATRLAAVAASLALGALLLYDFFKHGVFRNDLFGVMLLMAVVKLGAMLYYRVRD